MFCHFSSFSDAVVWWNQKKLYFRSNTHRIGNVYIKTLVQILHMMLENVGDIIQHWAQNRKTKKEAEKKFRLNYINHGRYVWKRKKIKKSRKILYINNNSDWIGNENIHIWRRFLFLYLTQLSNWIFDEEKINSFAYCFQIADLSIKVNYLSASVSTSLYAVKYNCRRRTIIFSQWVKINSNKLDFSEFFEFYVSWMILIGLRVINVYTIFFPN